jgi:phage protein U
MAVIGSLGQLVFKVSNKKVLTFSDLSRTNSMRWAKHDIIGGKPVHEFVGYESSKVSLSIRFDNSPIFGGVPPKKGLNRLKRMMENKMYKTLIIGGEYMGRYVLESVDEERVHHAPNGVCLVATAKINLVEYGK